MPPEREGDNSIVVAPYPVAWRVELVNDAKHRGFEYARFFWGTTNWVWTLANACKDNGAKVCPAIHDQSLQNRIWKLIPVKVEGGFTPSQPSSATLGSGSLPPYDGDAAGQSSTCTQHTESEHDEFGTIVKEVTVVTTTSTSTVTTHKKYRVEDG
ncbi:hypothetical protein BDM02DRAFT_3113172 [Thelephora ganbajun]|uniref:Uncharacterized protein n=1 Tax=Thelephora ganbajun TaxID=370292 RepID=A0ACB6ZJQ9_THEGA|nr:hypothetical protein BDM02DRAFT_3113172 [Thelephora ganbajun]